MPTTVMMMRQGVALLALVGAALGAEEAAAAGGMHGGGGGSGCGPDKMKVFEGARELPGQDAPVPTETATTFGMQVIRIPESHQGGKVYFPSVPVPAGTPITLKCCSGHCDFFVSIFSCPKCGNDVNGGLNAQLLHHGFEASRRCAPLFKLGVPEDPFLMASFFKKMKKGDEITLTTTGVAHYMAIFGQHGDGQSNVHPHWCPPPQGAWLTGTGECRCPPLACAGQEMQLVEAANPCTNRPGHGLWFDDRFPSNPAPLSFGLWNGEAAWEAPGKFVEDSVAGTGTITGVVVTDEAVPRRFALTIELQGKTTTGIPFGEGVMEIACLPLDFSAWYYYPTFTGTLKEIKTSGPANDFEVINRAHPKHGAQVGYGANAKNGKYGISFWIGVANSKGEVLDVLGDLNSDIVCPREVCKLVEGRKEASGSGGLQIPCEKVGSGHGLWLDDRTIKPSALGLWDGEAPWVQPAAFVEGAIAGTATIEGEVLGSNGRKFKVEVTLSGKAPAGSPFGLAVQTLCYDLSPADWYYYKSYTGKLTEIGGAGSTWTIVNKSGKDVQVGAGANLMNARHGISFWFGLSENADVNGDLNSDIVCETVTV